MPFGYRVETRIQRGLVVVGAITLGAIHSLYVIGISTVLFDGEDNAKDKEIAPALIPVVGPFIALGTVSEAEARPGLVLGGLTQSAGLTMLIVGLVARNTFLVRNDLSRAPTHWPEVLVGSQEAGLRWRF